MLTWLRRFRHNQKQSVVAAAASRRPPTNPMTNPIMAPLLSRPVELARALCTSFSDAPATKRSAIRACLSLPGQCASFRAFDCLRKVLEGQTRLLSSTERDSISKEVLICFERSRG